MLIILGEKENVITDEKCEEASKEGHKVKVCYSNVSEKKQQYMTVVLERMWTGQEIGLSQTSRLLKRKKTLKMK